jgi:molybdenum cofactor guanylyltransferase
MPMEIRHGSRRLACPSLPTQSRIFRDRWRAFSLPSTGLPPIGLVSWILSATADCPFLPRDLVARLHHACAEQNTQLAVAASGGQSHPVIGLWSVALREDLRHALVVENVRKIDRWTARYRLATETWPAEPLDPFFNANTMDDIAEAERLAELDGG